MESPLSYHTLISDLMSSRNSLTLRLWRLKLNITVHY